MSNIVNHKIHSSKKTREEYFIPAMRELINNASYATGYHSRLDTLYKLAEGIIDTSAYEYVTNPTNVANDDLKKYPAKLRNFDIIRPIIELFLGENGRRPDDATVIAKNADSVTKYKEARLNMVRANYAQQFVNELNAVGYQTGVESQETPPVEDALKEFDITYDDERAIHGQNALDVIRQDLDFDEKLQELLYDWLVAGLVITHKDIYMNDISYTVCDPRDVYVVDVPNTGFIEDSTGVVYRMQMSRTEIVNRFNEELEKEKAPRTSNSDTGENDENMLEWLMTYRGLGVGTTSAVDLRTEVMDGETENVTSAHKNPDKFTVWLCNWVGLEKVGNLTYQDPKTGQIANIEVDDTYVLDKTVGDIEIQWEWINVTYQGYRIEDRGYIDIKRLEVQRNELNNNAVPKLAFNGRFRGYRQSDIHSIVSHAASYQMLYNIFHFRFEFMLAKSKDKIMMMPIGAIPRKKGWDEDKWFYWANAHGIGWFDESAPNAIAALQGMKSLDMGLGNYIGQMWEYLNGIKMELWDSLGINRQRYGDTKATDGKATTENAVFRSAIITDDMFRQLNKFLEKDYEGLLDYSKVAWRDGKKSNYITSDNSKAFFDVEDGDHMGTDYGIFVKNVQEEMEKLERAKQAIQTFGQNGMTAPIALELLDSNNMSKIKQIAKKGLEIERAYQQQQQKQAEDAAAQIQQQQSADEQANREAERYKVDADNIAKKEVALINADAKLAEIYSDTINKNRELMESLGQDTIGRLDEIYAERNAGNDLTRAAIEREKISMQMANKAVDLKIAKENKNKHDK